MIIAILIIVILTFIGLSMSIPVIIRHLQDLDDEMHSSSSSLKMLTENLDEFEFEKGLKKWNAMGSRERNKRVAIQFLGWAHLVDQWQDRNGEMYDEPSDFEGENFSQFIHSVKTSEEDRSFIIYCLLWQKGFKIMK